MKELLGSSNNEKSNNRISNRKMGKIILMAYPYSEERCILASALRRDGYRVQILENGIDVLDRVADILLCREHKRRPDLIIAGLNLEGRKGIDLLADFRYAGWSVPFVLLSEKSALRQALEAQQLGRVAVFSSPFDLDDFRTVVSLLVERYERNGKQGIEKQSSFDDVEQNTTAYLRV